MEATREPVVAEVQGFLWGELPCFLSQKILKHPQRTPGKRPAHTRAQKALTLRIRGASYLRIYRAVKYEQALRRKNRTIQKGLLSPGKEARLQSEERRGSGGFGELTLLKAPSRPYEVAVSKEISSRLRKIEWFRGCRQGANPPSPLALGPEQPRGKAGCVSTGQPRGRVQVR